MYKKSAKQIVQGFQDKILIKRVAFLQASNKLYKKYKAKEINPFTTV